MTNPAPITLEQLFRFFRGLPHQLAAIAEMEDDIRQHGYAAAMRRDRPWFAAWSQDGRQSEPAAWLPLAQPLVAQFEGCRLTAYPDPGTGGDPWTIGYGHTGPDVTPAQVITQERAEQLLAADLETAAQGLFRVLPMATSWPPHRQAAMVSFVFNVGAGALEDSTIRRRLLAGDDPATVIREELPRWNHCENGVMEGLIRRRAAEVALFLQQGTAPAPAPAGAAVLPTTVELPGFPWFPQLDNGPEGWRQCQTSSVAMCLRFLKVPGINDDTDYLKVVERHGDTTDQAAHAKALAELGVKARFTRTLSLPALREQIRAGRPVAIGMLHHGPASAPTGGGHYIAVFGFTPTHLIVNDPYGEQDLVHGSWTRQGGDSGRGQRYSIANVTPRWLPEGPASGWAWLFS